MNKENIKKTISILKEISKTNQELLSKILDLSGSSTESFSASDLKEIPKWAKTTMDLLNSVVLCQSRMETKLINLEVKPIEGVKTEIKREDTKKEF